MKKTLIIGRQKYLKKNNVYISEWCHDNYHSIPRNYFFKSSINKKKIYYIVTDYTKNIIKD